MYTLARHSVLRTSASAPTIHPKKAFLLAAFVFFGLSVVESVAGFQSLMADEVSSSKADSNSLIELACYRGPVDVWLTEDESQAVTINQLSNTLSLVDVKTGKILDEVRVGERPAGLAGIGKTEFVVSCQYSGELFRYSIENGKLHQSAMVKVGFEPLGIAADEQSAFVGLQATGEIAEINLSDNSLVRKFEVGVWPRYLALTPNGKRLAVGLSGASSLAVLDRDSGETLYEEPLSSGINIGHLQPSKDGTQVYFPWMVYRANPITVRNIQKGWVLASRIARVQTDGPAYREAISLDVPRKAVADPHGIALTEDERWMASSSSGTHELLVYRLSDVPFVSTGGPGDLIDTRLEYNQEIFYRLELGGRPMGMQASVAGHVVYVANDLRNSVQIVDLEKRQVLREISLGNVSQDLQKQLIHRGREIFHDAEYSLDQWYSCNSCHLDGGTNAKPMDTWNDGTELTHKTVLPLAGVMETNPWTWHGWQEDLSESIQNSFVSTMKGRKVNAESIEALRAYLATIKRPPNPFVGADGNLGAAALRGKLLFESSEVGCAECHSGPNFTDGEIHDVGMTRESDYYEGYNTPSLRGVYRKPRLLHDGRSRTLTDVLKEWHQPQEIGGGAKLSSDQLGDLIEYLKTL